jgi:hypothetical protein
MGLVLVVLDAPIGGPGYDVLPNPLGWLLVMVGVRQLPDRIGHRRLLLGLAVVAGLVSVALWLPGAARELQALDASLRWALDLPPPVFVLVLALALGAAADRAGDAPARAWWRVVLAGAVLTALLPPVVYGAGATSLAAVAVAVAIGTQVTCLVLCFAHSARPWVHDAPAEAGPLPR